MDDIPWDFEAEKRKNAALLRAQLKSALEPLFGEGTEQYVEPLAEIAEHYAGRVLNTRDREARARKRAT